MIEKINELSGVSSVGGVKFKRDARFDLGEETASSHDDLAVSSFAREMANISASLSKVPEIREAKVEDLKRQIDEGTYKPDLRALANRLVWAGINKIES